MCLGIPMQIRSIEGLVAQCEAKGATRQVNLLMLEHAAPAVGDHVVVHLGYAIEKLTPEQAAEAWAIYDEMLAAEDRANTPAGTIGAADSQAAATGLATRDGPTADR